ncbi:hypothetical protein AB0J80_24800 [Actinoplanes sp. NPDC049548]|uniref:hypothetical protein n=1 Tax=Actinoplanes sp. NPDC049548 TaxID=3155152 RepID=UPI00342477B4
MAMDTTGQYWRGEDAADLVDYLREFQAGGYPVRDVIGSVCSGCGGETFRVTADDEASCVQRVCVTCGMAAYLADSAEYAAGADLQPCECPCGGERFEVAVGFAYRSDAEVRWVSVGLRCLADGVLGVYADWKIDYSPTAHLLTSV